MADKLMMDRADFGAGIDAAILGAALGALVGQWFGLLVGTGLGFYVGWRNG